MVRGGAGIYYGLNVATNYQSPGPAFGSSNGIQFSKDNFDTRFATLADPFPGGFASPQGEKYGKLAMWGYNNNNTLGTTEARNAEIYQWNLGSNICSPEALRLGRTIPQARAGTCHSVPVRGQATKIFSPQPFAIKLWLTTMPARLAAKLQPMYLGNR